MMLARAAESLYWMGRYLERAEQTSRLLDVTHLRLLESPVAERTPAWSDVLDIVGLSEDRENGTLVALGPKVARHLMSDTSHPGSISSSVERVRENAQGVREQLPVELWHAINTFRNQLRARDLDAQLATEPHSLYQNVRSECQSIVGVANATWIRSDPSRFFNIGLQLERAILTARLVRVRHPRHADPAAGAWATTLRNASALQAHRRHYQLSVTAESIVEMLVLSPDLPRSVLFCVSEADDAIQRLEASPTADLTARLLGRLKAELEFSMVGELIDHGVEASLLGIEQQLRNVHAALAAEFFLVPVTGDLHTMFLGAIDSFEGIS